MARNMKDSGIEWIGEIPEGWEIVPVRSCFDEVRTKNTDGQEQNALQFKSGNIISKTNFNASMDDYVADTITNYTVVLPDTVMINGLNLNYDFKSLRVALVKEKGVITSAYLAIFPDRKKISPQYATYLFKGYETKMAFHNMGAGILRAVGDSRRPLYFLIFCAVLNTLLDLLFVAVLRFGIAGAAWATILSQGISALLTLFVLTREKACYRIIWSKVRLDPNMTKKIFFLGLPSAIQMAVTSFSNVFVQAYINRFGSAAMAGWSSYGKLDKFCVLPIQSLSLGVTTFVGQNLGARKIDRVRQSTKVGTLLCFAVAILITIPVLIFARPLVSMFNRTPEVLDYGTLFIRLEMPFYLALCVNQVHAGTLRGIGNTKAPMVIMMSCFIVFRQIYLYTITQFTDSVIAVALGYPLGWVLCSICLFTYYRHTKLETYLR